MPSVGLTVTSEDLLRIVAAIDGETFPRLDGESDGMYAKRYFIKLISHAVYQHEVALAQEAAAATVVEKGDIVT